MYQAMSAMGEQVSTGIFQSLGVSQSVGSTVFLIVVCLLAYSLILVLLARLAGLSRDVVARLLAALPLGAALVMVPFLNVLGGVLLVGPLFYVAYMAIRSTAR
jgi:hypothetical protein